MSNEQAIVFVAAYGIVVISAIVYLIGLWWKS